MIPTWLCIPALQPLQRVAVNGAGGTGLPTQGSPVLTCLSRAGKFQCMETLIWSKSQALGRKMSISTSIYKTKGVTTEDKAWKQKSQQKMLTLLLPGLGEEGDAVPQEQWERASVHPFSFLLKLQMSTNFGREVLSSGHSMWEGLSGEQQHSHTLSPCAGSSALPELCTFTSAGFNPSWHVSDGRGCF